MANETTNLLDENFLPNLDDSLLLIGVEEELLCDGNDGLGTFVKDIQSEQQPSGNNTTTTIALSNVDSNYNTMNQYPNLPPAFPAPATYEPGMMNAVHMEVQENAKISTFLHPIDRSNSNNGHASSGYPRFQVKKTKSKSSKSRSNKQQKVAHEPRKMISLQKTSEDDQALPEFLKDIDFDDNESSSSGSFNLTEMFLGIDDRSSAADAYKSAGTHTYNTVHHSLQKYRDGDATFLKNNVQVNREPNKTSGQPHINSTADFDSNINKDKDQQTRARSYSYNYYPYGRHEMLPMSAPPSKPGIGPTTAPRPSTITFVPSKIIVPNMNNVQDNISNASNVNLNKNTSNQLTQPVTSTSGNERATYLNPNPMPNSITESNNMSYTGDQKFPLPAKQGVPHHLSPQLNLNKTLDKSISKSPSSHQPSFSPGRNSYPQANINQSLIPQTSGVVPVPIPTSLASTGKSNESTKNIKRNKPIHQMPKLLDAKIQSKPVDVSNSSTVLPQKISNNIQPHYVYRSSSSHQTSTTPCIPQKIYPKKSIGKNNQDKLILEAGKRQNQFGFGGNHKVPSVPEPPPFSRSTPKFQVAPQKIVPKTPTIPLNQTTNKLKMPIVPPVVKDPFVNKAAYERKKQRAKDSRVRLNEAIEKLSLSISVAGIESDRRAKADLGFQPATTKVMEKCVRCAKDAKKWDRPSFIDTAASLIQLLHEQCEALEQEVHILKNASSSKVRKAESDDENAKNSKKRKYEIDSSNDDKKIDYFQKIVDYDTVLLSLASFIDPLSLTRCAQVSKYWKAIQQFKCDEVWDNLCIHRFGKETFDVWRKQIDESIQKGDISKKINIYRQMQELNIKPLCDVEGNVSLGSGKVNGLSAWASMLERSNGETLRSVCTPPLNVTATKGNNYEKSFEPEYKSLPIVEIRIVMQNTGNTESIVVSDQIISIDAGTKRKGEEMLEITSDERLARKILTLDGEQIAGLSGENKTGECVRLKLFDSIVLCVHIYARGCPTASKFRSKANFTKVLVAINGTTVPVLIPFSDVENKSIVSGGKK